MGITFSMSRLAGYLRGTGTSGNVQGSTIPNVNTTDIQVQFGSAVVVTNASGDATIAYTQSFANGTITVLLTNGDSGVFGDLVVGGTAYNASGFNVRCINGTNSAPVVGTLRINYMAIGW